MRHRHISYYRTTKNYINTRKKKKNNRKSELEQKRRTRVDFYKKFSFRKRLKRKSLIIPSDDPLGLLLFLGKLITFVWMSERRRRCDVIFQNNRFCPTR